MKKFLSTAAFCTLLLAACLYIVRPTSSAGETLSMQLLNLPAPPPLNPLVDNASGPKPASFYDPTKPPPDEASIDDLVDYWTSDEIPRYGVRWNPKPSPKVLSRLLAETANDPALLPRLMTVLPNDKATGDFVKRYYDQMGSKPTDEDDYSPISMREWLTNNTAYFSDDLARDAARVRDTGTYVSGEDDSLRNLARIDYEKARPIIERLYNDRTQPNSRTAALWAMYRHALDVDSLDADTYRDELKQLVGDKNQSPAVRDIANDALSLEREFAGRDEWFLSLFEDETFLAITEFTGITTLVNNSPPDRFLLLLLPLLEKENITGRSAAARNLLVLLAKEKDEERQKMILKALLPWLSKPEWLNEKPENRTIVVNALAKVKLPESVMPLIAALDEKVMVDAESPGYNLANRPVNSAAWANVANTAANAVSPDFYPSNVSPNSLRRPVNANSNGARSNGPKIATYPLRSEAINALGFQGDMRAVPHLRRMLQIVEQYEKIQVVKAIFLCNGFSVAEQVEAIEETVRSSARVNEALEEAGINYGNVSPEIMAATSMRMSIATSASNMVLPYGANMPHIGDPIKLMLGMHMSTMQDPSNALVTAAALRISQLEKPEPGVASTMREFVCQWKGRTVNAFILNDLKNNKATSTGVIRLLAERKDIRENQAELVANAASGTPFAAGIAACLMNSAGTYEEILTKGNAETVISLLSCGRLVRSEFPVPLVIKLQKSTDKTLALAAERYLDSEDSAEARAAITAIYPNQARISGANKWFKGSEGGENSVIQLSELFASVHPFFYNQYGAVTGGNTFETVEKRLQKEVTTDATLLAVYSVDDNFVRLFKDGAMFSWEDDPSRYRERKLTPEEFESFKHILIDNDAGDLKPFLSCRRYCDPKQLLMLTKETGRRVFSASDRRPKVFAELDELFKDFRAKPAKLRYWLEKEIPGLEIVFADDGKRALSVWKNGDDLRIVASDVVATEKREEEAREALRNYVPADDEDVDAPAMSGDGPKEEDSEPDGEFLDIAWFSVLADGSAMPTSQPDAVEYIPPPGYSRGFDEQDRWKLKGGGIELKTSEDGISKIAGGRKTIISKGRFVFPVITPNGKWFLANNFQSTGETRGLVRYNLQTNRSIPISSKELQDHVPVAFIPAVGKYLIAERSYSDEYDEAEAVLKYTSDTYFLVDPESGAVTPANGEMRPIAQQSFRQLQPSGKANEFWAAISESGKHETKVGTYNTATFVFKPVLTLPKIEFGSMDMWVDENSRKVFFVYNGHLLAIPLDAKPAAS